MRFEYNHCDYENDCCEERRSRHCPERPRCCFRVVCKRIHHPRPCPMIICCNSYPEPCHDEKHEEEMICCFKPCCRPDCRPDCRHDFRQEDRMYY